MKFELDLLDKSTLNIQNSKHVHLIQDLAKKILPASLFFLDEITEEKINKAKLYLDESLPIINWSLEDSRLSIILMCKHRANVGSFFYDMVSRWLIPEKKLNIDVFFSSDFKFTKLSLDKFTIMESTIHLENDYDLKEMEKNRRSFETEIRLGVASDYHANRIREFKGLSSDRKTAMVQEKIGSLIQSRPKDFGKNIFSEMQQFLIMSRDEFKSERDYHHISRIISILYMIRKLLKQNMEVVSNKRYVILKFLKTKLKSSDNKEKMVLGVLVGLNFLKKHEIFEKKHLIEAIKKFLPQVKAVENSYFMDKLRNSIQTCYVEIEKPDSSEFSLDEIQQLKVELPIYLKGNVEYLIHPVFMPRNEEEIVRNIMTLSNQLKYVHDIPQVIISFEKQTSADLSFNIIILRVLRQNDLTLKDIFERINVRFKFIVDRSKKVGVIRRRYLKEANVFRAFLPSSNYLRSDHTVDLHKARQDVLKELMRIFGDVRDYNGGMILKQNEGLEALQSTLGQIAKQNDSLLEKFFYSITPVEMTTIVKTDILKNLFLLLINAIKRQELRLFKNEDGLYKKESKQVYAIIPTHDITKKKKVEDAIDKLNLLSSEIISFSLNSHETTYLGYAYLCDKKEKQNKFFETIQSYPQ